jgi:hypothetical protein
MDSFLEFLGTFPLGFLVFCALALVVFVCVAIPLRWLVVWVLSKITGMTIDELSAGKGGRGGSSGCGGGCGGCGGGD